MELDFTNETLERILVKKSLVDKRFLGVIAPISDMRWFETSKSLGILNKLIVKYYNAYDDLPSSQVVKAMVSKYCQVHQDTNESEVLKEFTEVQMLDVDLSLDVVKNNIERFVKGKLLYYTTSDIAVDVVNNGQVDKYIDRFEKIQKLTFENTNLGMSYFNKDDQEKHWDYIKNPDARISTGFEGLDRYTHGGFYRGGKMVACIMGQAGLGKSLFLSNIAVNCLKENLSVVVISLEMSENVYATRFDAHISNSNINALKENSVTAVERIRKFYDEHPNANLFIKEFPPRSVKVSDIRIYLDNLMAAGNRFDIIVIDYLNLVRPNKNRDNMYQDIQDVSERLRELSYIYEVPVVTATQANRQGMNNENIGMEHVSESNGISQTVDFLAGLYQMDEDRENGIINMRILKNRLGGQVGKVIPFSLDPQSLVLHDNSFTPEGTMGMAAEADSIVNNLGNIEADMDI